MFARNVSLHLKPNSLNDFTITFGKEIIPLLRRQPGFRDEIVLVGDGTNSVTAISLWDTREQADCYATSTYHEVLKVLAAFLDGPAKVTVMIVANSTLHRFSAACVVAA